MALLTDADLRAIITDDWSEKSESKLVISPFAVDCLTPVGYDLRVGSLYTTSDVPTKRTIGESDVVSIRPHTTALVRTLEKVKMPRDRSLSGLIASKVSQVAKGLSHVSTTVDADWSGELLIVLHNHSLHEIEIPYGSAFCTAVFLENRSPAQLECEKPPGRTDILMDAFNLNMQRAHRRRRWQRFVGPGIIVGSTALGYAVWHSTEGLVIGVTAGAALSQWAQGRR